MQREEGRIKGKKIKGDCNYCGNPGHTEEDCWTSNPSKHPVNHVSYEVLLSNVENLNGSQMFHDDLMCFECNDVNFDKNDDTPTNIINSKDEKLLDLKSFMNNATNSWDIFMEKNVTKLGEEFGL